jgi:hypothetical protein
MHAWRDFDLRCFLGKLGILDRRPVPLSVAIRRAYADYSKSLECCRKAGRRWYYRNHQEQLERATRYRQANRKPVARRQREWIERKLEADPTHPAKDLSSDQLEKALPASRCTPRRPSLELLGCSWRDFVCVRCRLTKIAERMGNFRRLN